MRTLLFCTLLLSCSVSSNAQPQAAVVTVKQEEHLITKSKSNKKKRPQKEKKRGFTKSRRFKKGAKTAKIVLRVFTAAVMIYGLYWLHQSTKGLGWLK